MLNLNVGVLGHVDCGKTTIVKALSQIGSTAAFDKSPQSQERGITLDLGFSSFNIPAPKHLQDGVETGSDARVQFTLVDCPGHASLIRTVIGGAQIIDMMLLVIDATKGIQTQTAECLVIGELTCREMIVVVNKIDLVTGDRQKATEKITKRLRATLSRTAFQAAPLVFVAARPSDGSAPIGMEALVQAMADIAFVPERGETAAADFVLAVDHCFGVKGQGTVMTGTVLQGSIRVNDSVLLPLQQLCRKVKSMQVFRRPVSRAAQGDRIGICVTHFDPKLFERGIACASEPHCPTTVAGAALVRVHRIQHFAGPIKSKARFHVTAGYATVMATITCFSTASAHLGEGDAATRHFNFDLDYKYCDELGVGAGAVADAEAEADADADAVHFMLLEFEKAIVLFPRCLLIGSRLDVPGQSKQCRLAFWGTLLAAAKDGGELLTQLRLFKTRRRTGTVERALGEQELIVRGMFRRGESAHVQQLVGARVALSTGEAGRLVGQFGQGGKIKVHVEGGLGEEASHLLKQHTVANRKQSSAYISVVLELKEPVLGARRRGARRN